MGTAGYQPLGAAFHLRTEVLGQPAYIFGLAKIIQGLRGVSLERVGLALQSIEENRSILSQGEQESLEVGLRLLSQHSRGEAIHSFDVLARQEQQFLPALVVHLDECIHEVVKGGGHFLFSRKLQSRLSLQGIDKLAALEEPPFALECLQKAFHFPTGEV